jgi:hypothetical protein
MEALLSPLPLNTFQLHIPFPPNVCLDLLNHSGATEGKATPASLPCSRPQARWALSNTC